MKTDLELQKELEEKQEELNEDGTPKEPDKTSTKDETKPDEWDKERQKQDFERANSRYKRAEANLSTMTEAYEQANAKLADLERQVQTLTQTKQAEQDKLDEMDPELVDEKVANNIRRLEARLKEKENQLNHVIEKIEIYEQKIAEDDAKRRNEEAREDVLTTVEDALAIAGVGGAAKYRNEAIKLADDLVDSGEERQPGPGYKGFKAAVKLMTKCYLQVRSNKEKGKTRTVSVDTGKGGAVQTGAPRKTGIKEGALKDVAAQMLKDDSWLKEE